MRLYSINNYSHFITVPADKLWKGVTSVSNAGRKRGRGRAVGKKTFKNLNRGQVIGIGNIYFNHLLNQNSIES